MIRTAYDLKTIGKLLKEKRIEKNYSIKQISDITKINPEYLSALEEARYDKIPSEVYVKGFLKNYAKFLGIDGERALALYRRERERSVAENPIKEEESVVSSYWDFSITPSKIIAGLIIIAIFLTLIYVGSYVNQIFSEPEIELNKPVTLSAGETDDLLVTSNKIELEGSTEIGAKLTINGQEYQTNSFEQFNVELNLDKGLNTIQIVSESEFGKSSVITLNVIRENPPKNTPDITTTPIANKNIKARLEVIAEGAYLEVIVDDELVLADIADLGSILEYQASNFIEIFIPRPETVTLLINNREQVLATTRIRFELKNGQIIQKDL